MQVRLTQWMHFLQLKRSEKLVWECNELWKVTKQPNTNKPIRRSFSYPFYLAIYNSRHIYTSGNSGNVVVFDPLIHFPPHLHGHTPALHGRETVAYTAVAAIGGGLGCVGL